MNYFTRMYKVMFVCMGNVCRSPLAQVLLENYIEGKGLQKYIGTESSGVNVYNEGQRACEEIRLAAAARGIPFDHYSRRFTISDINEYNLILAMDEETMRRVREFGRSVTPKGEIRFFRDFDPLRNGNNEVPDPWGAFSADVEEVFSIIERTIKPLVDTIPANNTT